jgi:type I restriction enzyme M protein
MDSQGDAGQFRTPRHIIDFIVQAVDPQKTDSILDPACGTAGFLISAYKHILAQNAKDGKDGGSLTPDERAHIMDNIVGYDISPDMVRLSRVNMYLHNFSTPHIHEYDTLTSEDKWGEYYDVIMANPPFMTPKGGIMPHQRFSVQAKRSEILFVDYIAEHLLQNGRAGVIVPEGIIFQSGNAYKNLRKMLVNDYLYAVVSLPAGIFNPYSGVKTSILLMDRHLSQKTDSILFVKVENDGFSLGAQRKPNGKSDLPEAERAISEYKKAVLGGKAECNSALGLVVKKSAIAKEADYILTMTKYLSCVKPKTIYQTINVADALEDVKYTPKLQTNQYANSGKYPIIDQSANAVAGYSDDESLLFHIAKPVVLFGDHTRTIKYVDFDFILGADGVKILQHKGKLYTLIFLLFD